MLHSYVRNDQRTLLSLHVHGDLAMFSGLEVWRSLEGFLRQVGSLAEPVGTSFLHLSGGYRGVSKS